MSVESRLTAWISRLGPPETLDVRVERDVRMPMPDGVDLLGDHYAPVGLGERPTILIRSPYGRRGMFGMLFGPPFAERGFHVFIQSCRGTFGSGGTFDPYHHEHDDGLATVDWLRAQPWYSGELATQGPSYLGLCQWAVAADAGPDLKAMSIQMSTHDFRSVAFEGGSFTADFTLGWARSVTVQEGSRLGALSGRIGLERKLDPACRHQPLREADVVAVGRPVPFLRDWLDHCSPGDPWWDPITYTRSVEQLRVPVQLIGGWFDAFLPHMVEEYAILRRNGLHPHLTVGPWNHGHPGSLPPIVRESLGWFRAHLGAEPQALRAAPVRLYMTGAEEWWDFDDWPPAGYTLQKWFLQAEAGLAPATPARESRDSYTYDPADPTPAVGGTSVVLNAGRRDQQALEARPDVLTYTTTPLERSVEVVGPVHADIFFSSSVEHTDLFVRLCDVSLKGKSVNICDGIVRLEPDRPPAGPDGSRRVTVGLWPTAHRFLPGHRIRLQVSSGAHPRFIRNPGTGEPLGLARSLVTAAQTVRHGPAHPSAVVLPVRVG